MSFYTTSSHTTTSPLATDTWEKAHYLTLTLWDIEREFQKSFEAYEQWRHLNKPKRWTWDCLNTGQVNDELGKALRLGRHIRELLEKGIEVFGSDFEQGDCKFTAYPLPLYTSITKAELQQDATPPYQHSFSVYSMK
jgi:hypothetical protein